MGPTRKYWKIPPPIHLSAIHQTQGIVELEWIVWIKEALSMASMLWSKPGREWQNYNCTQSRDTKDRFLSLPLLEWAQLDLVAWYYRPLQSHSAGSSWSQLTGKWERLSEIESEHKKDPIWGFSLVGFAVRAFRILESNSLHFKFNLSLSLSLLSILFLKEADIK